MGLKFRRGSTAQQSGSLAFGEPYVNTTLGTLVVGGATGDIVLSAGGTGSTGNFGAISGSGLDITGNANIAGNLTLGGTITIGDNNSDNVVVNADLSSSIIPNDDNAFDLGSTTKKYKNIYTNGLSASVIEINSGSNPEIRLINRTTGIEYHIQNGDGGHFQIHNGTTNDLLFKFNSASLAEGNQDGYFYANLYVSKSIDAHQALIESIIAGGITGSLSGSVAGIGNVTTYSTSVDSRLTQLSTASGSAITRLTTLEVDTTNLETFSGSQLTQNSNLATITGSLISTASANSVSVANLNTLTSSALVRFTNLESTSASVNTSVTNLNSTTASLTQRVAANEAVSGTFARTNSANTFNGTQTVSGSLYVTQDLVVAGSSSIQNISSSNLVIGAAFVTLNTNSPAARFAGINIIDSGSVGLSGSFFYDSVQDEFIQIHKGNGTSITSSHFVQGPQTYDNVGNEIYLTNNRLTKGTGLEHIVDSQITDDGTTVTIPGALNVTGGITGSFSGNVSTATKLATARTINGTSFDGSANITIPNLVSGSAQIDGSLLGSNKTITVGSTSITLGGTATTIAGLTSVTSTAFVGALTGNASTVTTNANLTGNVTSVGNATTIASGVVTSDMIVDGTIVNGDINASAAIVDTKLATISTAGKVSNSATTATSANTLSAIVARDASGNFSAGTITAALTGNASTATTLQNARTINGTSFNGSADITIPNLVSGSAQITAGSTTNFATDVKTQLNSNTVVSGSSQVTLSSTTGYGSVLNQAVLTSSSPTFAGLTINGAITATGDITAYFTSDKRHKNNIQTIPNALEKVSKLNGVTWEWNDDVNEVTKQSPKTGLIAQEVLEVLPEVVKQKEDGFLGLDYSKMMGLLVEAIKEQQTQIEQLKAQIGSK